LKSGEGENRSPEPVGEGDVRYEDRWRGSRRELVQGSSLLRILGFLGMSMPNFRE
jgi:hypothetical protein